jgi:Zc3h12a-like Ribonuclease NYN domain
VIQKRTVVVDGSNLATEGRSLPSLVQLDECVRAFADEMPNAEIVVVVDATFEHRIEDRERKRFKEAELAGEVVTPPAGAIGRGDGFILKIAARTNAVVLSNDSFQEFHGEYPWLFDEGRLIGGKPIPGVGWVFTPRNPVRGPKSRASRARQSDDAPGTTTDAPVAKSRRGASKATPPDDAAPSKRRATDVAKRAPAKPLKATVAKPTRGASGTSPSRRAPSGVDSAELTTKPVKRAAKATSTNANKPTTPKTPSATKRRTAAPSGEVPAKGIRAPATVAAKVAGATKTRSTAVDAASRASKREGTGPVNTPRAFNALVKEHPLRSKVEGEVVAFTSHGATISVAVGKGMEAVCYAPLARLGRPAPTRARDVLKKGERRSFRVVAFDNERRIAEVSLG